VRKITRRALLGVAGAGATLMVSASPAFASTISNPNTNPFTVSECTNPAASSGTCDNTYADNNVGAPVAFQVNGTGVAGKTYFLEICDGKSPSSVGFNANTDCDSGTATTGHVAQSDGTIPGWAPGNTFDEVGVFRGQSPSDLFNCLAPGDVAASGTTLAGEPIDSSKPSWTNCQMRLAQNTTTLNAGDDSYLTLSIPNQPASQVPDSPLAILLPVSAFGLLGGGLLIARRRRRASLAA